MGPELGIVRYSWSRWPYHSTVPRVEWAMPSDAKKPHEWVQKNLSVSVMQVISAQGTYLVPLSKTMSKAKWNFNSKVEAVKAKLGKHRVPALTSLKSVCAALEITERWVNCWPMVEKKHSVKERTNGENCDKRQRWGSYLWVFYTLGSNRWLVAEFQQWYRCKSCISVFGKLSFHA